MSEEKTLECVGCGAQFGFTTEEQEFYAAKGFSEPKRCKPCRDAAKQQRRGGGGGGYGGGGGRDRQFFDAVCAGCGVNTQVPFQPDGRKPVYCRDCFRSTTAAY